jgi:2-dehydro-3-deoxyglucarate aldolase/4-hydroxy-2-oxoheptanedioate aldolase
MHENPLKRKIAAGGPIIGTMLKDIQTPLIIPLLANSGLDFAIVDTEHGPFSYADIQDLVLVAKNTDFTVLVRPPGSDYISIARALDNGAQGLMVPRVETPEEVQQIISACKYPPTGNRGYGPGGIITDFQAGASQAEKMETINSETLLILQIENRTAVEQIEEMVAPPAVDGVIIGPADLSVSLGMPGDLQNSEMVAAIDRVVAACQARGIPSGIHVRDLDLLRQWQERGMTLLMYSSPLELIQSELKRSVAILRPEE